MGPHADVKCCLLQGRLNLTFILSLMQATTFVILTRSIELISFNNITVYLDCIKLIGKIRGKLIVNKGSAVPCLKRN